jgi:hypothetical protein
VSGRPAIDLAIPLIGFNPSGGIRMVIHVANQVAARGHHVAFTAPAHAATPPIELHPKIQVFTRGPARGLRDRIAFEREMPPARVYLATGYQTPLLIERARRRANARARIVHLVQADEITTHIRLGSQRTWLKPMLHTVARRGLEVPAIRIAVSHAVADAVGRDRIHRIINPGIEERYIERARETTPVRRERRHDDPGRLTIGFFAQSGQVKGTAIAIDALQRFAASDFHRWWKASACRRSRRWRAAWRPPSAIVAACASTRTRSRTASCFRPEIRTRSSACSSG